MKTPKIVIIRAKREEFGYIKIFNFSSVTMNKITALWQTEESIK